MPLDGKVERFTRTLPDAQEWRQVLLNAAQYIRDHGWWQSGIGLGPCGEVCMMQAIYAANDPRCPQDSPTDYARAFIIEMTGGHSAGGMFWNDAPGRTAAEVIATLESAAYAP